MRNKILTLVIVTVSFAILLLTASFIIITNIQQMESTRDALKSINCLISQFNNIDDRELNAMNNLKINESNIRYTLINIDGDVIYDNTGEPMENHKNRREIIEAIDNGEGYTTRYSDTMKTNYMYYATKINDNLILRSSVPISTIELLVMKRIKYYIVLIILVISFSVFLSLKFIRKVVEPVKDLERVTVKMANGDYKIRANARSRDELGTLGKSFNIMADELQLKIHEVTDKQRKLESILRSIQSGVIAIDNNDNVISINPCAELILGIKKSIIGKNLNACIKDECINEFLDDDEQYDKEFIISHPIERNLRITKTDMFEESAKLGRVILFQDITDLKRVELMRSQFVANVSHELKTPLTSIKGFAETLKIVNDDETRNKFLDIINKEAERLTRLINDILVLSNIESNLICDVEEFMPENVIEEVLNIVKENAMDKNIKIEFKDSNGELLLGDKDKFYQLCLNLIENAIKYSKENDGYVKISSYSENGEYYLSIKDNGIGIPEKDIPRVFERFYRVDKSRKKGGTGLGLAIVKHIVKCFNGEIFLESIIGEGSTFTVKIPTV